MPKATATSRAMPRMDRMSPRLGGGLDVQHAVAEVDGLDHVDPDRGVGRQDRDPEWSSNTPSSRAEASMPSDRAPRTLRRPISARAAWPWRRPRDDVAGGEVAGPADHQVLLGAEGVDADQHQPVGVGVLGHLEDTGREDAGRVVPDPVDGLDLDAGEGQLLGQGGRDVGVGDAQPARRAGRILAPL